VAESIVRERSYRFALGVVELCRSLLNQREYVPSKQMLRSGTSIGANVEEALAGQSRRDFISKMSIASKEARECHYWLRLHRDSKMQSPEEVDVLLEECTALCRMLTSIVKTNSESP
jgi:four helix bundle protein